MVNRQGQIAIAKAVGEQLSLLPLTSPIPMSSQWGTITWFSHVIADRHAGRAYIVGHGNDATDRRLYVASIDYQKTPAAVTLHYSEPLEHVTLYQPVLTPTGDLIIAGGFEIKSSNFHPTATVLLLHVGTDNAPLACAHKGIPLLPWLCCIATLAVLTAIILWRRKQSRNSQKASSTKPFNPTKPINPINPTTPNQNLSDDPLMQRICDLMEQQQLFKDSNLKLSDVADALGTNRTYISTCIRNYNGSSFSLFVNAYRVEYAQQLLRSNADIKLSEVWSSSGFSSESSFFRAFKTITGTTPKDWIAEG